MLQFLDRRAAGGKRTVEINLRSRNLNDKETETNQVTNESNYCQLKPWDLKHRIVSHKMHFYFFSNLNPSVQLEVEGVLCAGIEIIKVEMRLEPEERGKILRCTIGISSNHDF